jgi:predicted dehydrogenase
MRLLILGLSSIVERRVIPAAAKVEAIMEISIASKGRPKPNGWPKQGRFFNDYAAALRDHDSDLVYLSLPNAMHEHWVMAALAAGKHVVVDKPAMMTSAASARAVEAARRVNRAVAEATVFGHHPQFEALAAFVAEHGPLTQAAVQFIIPPLPIGNFRNHRDLGGGCLLDMGPYAAATMRILGGGRRHTSRLWPAAGIRRPVSTWLFDPGPARQWRRFFRPFQLRGRISESLARCGRFGVCGNRARLHPTRRSSDGMAPARTQCR